MATTDNANTEAQISIDELKRHPLHQLREAVIERGKDGLHETLLSQRITANDCERVDRLAGLFDKLLAATDDGIISVTVNTHFGAVTVPVGGRTAERIAERLTKHLGKRVDHAIYTALYNGAEAEADDLRVERNSVAARALAATSKLGANLVQREAEQARALQQKEGAANA